MNKILLHFFTAWASFFLCIGVALTSAPQNPINRDVLETPVVTEETTPVLETGEVNINIKKCDLSSQKTIEKNDLVFSNIIDISLYAETTEPVETSAETEEEKELTIQDLLDAELALVPEDDLQFLYDNGWSIELTDMDLAAEYGYSGSIVGITDYELNIIYIANREGAIRRAAIHEVGHALAAAYGGLDVTWEFINIYKEECEYFRDITSVGDGHEIESSKEYFASVYQNMCLDYERTVNDVPASVEYIERVLWEEGQPVEPTPTPASSSSGLTINRPISDTGGEIEASERPTEHDISDWAEKVKDTGDRVVVPT